MHVYSIAQKPRRFKKKGELPTGFRFLQTSQALMQAGAEGCPAVTRVLTKP
jgi:hypothetical protein